MTCPSCGSDNVHRSRRKWYERPISLIGIRPYRCYHCDRRFFSFPPDSNGQAADDKHSAA